MNFHPESKGGESARAENNFDFLRVVAAFLVIWGHQYSIFGSSPPGILGSSISTTGVKIFFAISGYLIAKSWDRDPHLIRFAIRRGLRIMPGLIAVCLFTVFLFGPVFTSLPLFGYFTDPRTYHYLWNNGTLFITYFLPGLFENNPIKGAVNGSLWSIPSEVCMYLIAAASGLLLGRLNRALFWAALLALAVAAKVYLFRFYRGEDVILYATSLKATVEVGVYFVAGAFLWKCNAFHRPRPDLALIALIVLFGVKPAVFVWIDSLLFAYAVLAFGLSSTPILNATGRYGDLSYGLYLYAFPMQQASYQIFGKAYGWWPPFAFVIVTTTLLAYLSWHLIEKRALDFKPGKAVSPKREPELGLQPVAAVSETG